MNKDNQVKDNQVEQAKQTVKLGDSPCTPLWQYLLLMGPELQALIKGTMRIGQYHSDKDLKVFVRWYDKAIAELREMNESLSEWKD